MMGTDSTPFATLGDLLAWCRAAPSGTRLDATVLATVLESVEEEGVAATPTSDSTNDRPSDCWTWRERLWTVPAETRLGTSELAEALGRPRSFIYARTQAEAEDPLPHRKLDGTLLFTAGEVRAWIRSREVEVVGGPMESTDRERREAIRAV